MNGRLIVCFTVPPPTGLNAGEDCNGDGMLVSEWNTPRQKGCGDVLIPEAAYWRLLDIRVGERGVPCGR